jgi:hypothetical protein
MIKIDAQGRYYVAADTSKTFKTYGEAATHEIVLQRAGESQRPDGRDAVQQMNDSAWQVPMAAKRPDRLARLEDSLRKGAADPAFRPGLPIGEVLLHNVKALRREQQDAEDRAAEAAEWNERPLIKAATAEAKRLLQEAESDYSIDKADVVKAEQLVKALSTPGADEGWIRSQLKSLLGVEEARKLAIREAATAELAAAQAKVNALGSAQQVAVRVPVEGDDLLSKGNSYTANLMASGAPPEQLAAAFDAMDKAFAGDTAALEATLAANGEATNVG